MRRLAALCLLLLLASCREVLTRNVKVDLVARQSSCGRTFDYDADCLSGLDVRIVRADGREVASHCSSIGHDFSVLHELVTASLPLLEDAEAVADVVIEVRIYHSITSDACSTRSESALMIWGRSDVVDLSDPSVDEIAVHLECRQDCDCADIGTSPSCPVDLERGVCVPSAPIECVRQCPEPPATCYGGELSCDGVNTCRPHAADALCAACTTAAACSSQVCVHRVEQGVNEQICSRPCPVAGQAALCPDEMACRRVDAAKYRLLP